MSKSSKESEREDPNVDHPSHYGGDTLYETIKVMEHRLTSREFIGAMKFNIYKYNDRAIDKGPEDENYRKAQFYQNYLVEHMRKRKKMHGHRQSKRGVE